MIYTSDMAEQHYGDWKDWLFCLAIIVALEARFPGRASQNPRGRSPRYWRKHREAEIKAEGNMLKKKAPTAVTPTKFDTPLVVAILSNIPTPLVALLQWNGVLSVNWKLSSLGYAVLVFLGLWAFWKWESVSHWNRTWRLGIASAMVLFLGTASVIGVVNQYRRENLPTSSTDKSKLEASFFTLDPRITPLREITVPRVRNTVTVEVSALNSGTKDAQNVKLWYRICDKCKYEREPIGAVQGKGAAEFDRQFNISEIAAGTLSEKISLPVIVPDTLQHFWIGMFYTCDDCLPVEVKNPQMLRVHIGSGAKPHR